MVDRLRLARISGSTVQPVPISAADRAYVSLRDRIITLSMKPGEPLNEDYLVELLGVGRTPVREAVKRLQFESLVTIFPRRGTFVSEVNITDLGYLSEIRVVLEGQGAYMAALRLTEERRRVLHKLRKKAEDVQSHYTFENHLTLDADIHRFLHSSCANPYLESALGLYFNLSLRIWHMVRDRLPEPRSLAAGFHPLLNAVDDARADDARSLAMQHVMAFGNELRNVL